MNESISMTVSGNKLILDNLDAAQKTIAERAQAKLEQAGEMGKQLAEQYAPVSDINEPGYVHMRDEMYVEVQPGIATIGNDSDHAIYNELGTSRMRSHPFLVPGATQAGYWLKDTLAGFV